MTHMGYLPDIGRWLFWGAVSAIVIVLVWVFFVVARWKYGRYKK